MNNDSGENSTNNAQVTYYVLSLMTHDRICQHCGKEFVSQKKSTKYYSHRCANLADKARKKAHKQLLKQENAKEARRQDLLQKNFLSITEAAKLLQNGRREYSYEQTSSYQGKRIT